MLVAELRQTLGRIATHAEHYGPHLRQRCRQVTEIACLLGTAGRHRLGIKVEYNRLSFEVSETGQVLPRRAHRPDQGPYFGGLPATFAYREFTVLPLLAVAGRLRPPLRCRRAGGELPGPVSPGRRWSSSRHSTRSSGFSACWWTSAGKIRDPRKPTWWSTPKAMSTSQGKSPFARTAASQFRAQTVAGSSRGEGAEAVAGVAASVISAVSVAGHGGGGRLWRVGWLQARHRQEQQRQHEKAISHDEAIVEEFPISFRQAFAHPRHKSMVFCHRADI